MELQLKSGLREKEFLEPEFLHKMLEVTTELHLIMSREKDTDTAGYHCSKNGNYEDSNNNNCKCQDLQDQQCKNFLKLIIAYDNNHSNHNTNTTQPQKQPSSPPPHNHDDYKEEATLENAMTLP